MLGFLVYVISSLFVSQTWVSLNNLRTSQWDPGLVKPPHSLIVRATHCPENWFPGIHPSDHPNTAVDGKVSEG